MAETDIDSAAPKPHRSPSEPGETRAETQERVLEEIEEVRGEPVDSFDAADSSVRRGVPRRLGRSVARWVLAGAGIGAIVGAVLLVTSPSSVDASGVAGGIGLIVGGALVFALIGGVFGALFLVEREDGRVEREVEKTTGEDPGAPADALDPKHDVKKA